MKTLKFLLIGAVVLFGLAACSDDVKETVTPNQDDNQVTEYDEAYYAALASISSSDAYFSATDGGGTISFGVVGGEVEVNVNCETEWVAQNNAEDTFGYTVQPTSIIISAGRNITEGVLKGSISLATAEQYIVFAEITITQSWESIEPLVLEYTVTDNKATIQLPICNVNNATIDWDDDNTETTSEDYPSHTYSLPGIYTVTINGIVEGIRSYENGKDVDGRNYLTGVKSWGNTGLTSMQYAFYGSENLSSLPEGAGPFSNVTSFGYTFCGCSSLTSVPENLFSNCQAVESFSTTFEGCSSLTTVPENLFFNCPNVTSFGHTFFSCSSLTSIPENLFSSCPNVTSFKSTFFSCSSLTSIPEHLFSSCPNVTDFVATFCYCQSLTSIPENLFSSCPAVEDFTSTFSECSSLTSIPENLFSSCPAVVWFSCTFAGCSSLTSIPENLFSSCPNVITFDGTFLWCFSLTSIPENLFSSCPNVTNFYQTFVDCTSLATVPENLFSNCPNVTSFSQTFSSCSALKTVPVNIFDNTPLVTNFHYTFYKCSSVEGESPYTEIEVDGEMVKVHLYERSEYAEYLHCAAPESFGSCFAGSSFSDINSIPSDWK